MYDITLPVADLPIMSPGQNDDYFKEHYSEWEQEVLNKLAELGYPVELWPSDAPGTSGFVRFWKSTGLPRNPAPVNLPMDKRPFSGPPMPAQAVKLFNNSFPHVTNAFFCITKGEEWWQHDKAFLCNDAESYMKLMLYTAALMNPDIMDKPVEKKLGRPRNEAAHAAKAEKSARYQQWLADCETYRAEIAGAENAYLEAKAVAENYRLELNRIKARGAPKWIP